MKIHLSATVCCACVLISSLILISMSVDTLTRLDSITCNETLVSAKKQFQLGFFSPGNSKKFYMGIWFNIMPIEIVWIANREYPLNDTCGVAKIGNDGNLILLDTTERIVWSTDLQSIPSRNATTVAQLLDSGNFVFRDNEEGTILWQSFDHPSHALLPGMKIGWDLRTGLIRNLTSWKDPDDPSPGEYIHGFDLQGLPQLTIWKATSKQFRSGPWNGVEFSDLTYLPNTSFSTQVTVDSQEVYYEHRLNDNSSFLMAAISYSGVLQLSIRDNSSDAWHVIGKLPANFCGFYGYCGPNAVCTISDALICSCITGYTPKNFQDWEDRSWSGGCIREKPFNCSEAGLFKEFESLKMPDLLHFSVNTSMSLEECESACSRNCSCTAYANADAIGAVPGCLLWFGDLIDVSNLTTNSNQKLYIRVTAADLVSESNSKNEKKMIIVIVVIMISGSILLLLFVLFFIWKRKSLQEDRRQSSQMRDEENFELPYFDIVTIAKATDNFLDTNKIGEGGFGPVYKGKLSTGQDIAIKRLSEHSHQGLVEFRNEVMLIAKLQHRNLVRLLGYCIHEKERMLIYEYMSNGSLDSYISGDSSCDNKHLFVWKKRFAIIVGIARGLLYLHQDSRLRIIHRDLKASNVLLGSEMDPKISDFGLARAFGEEQSTVRTNRIAGTYGYMAPEYAIDGIYSMKSDIFSFGVIILEILSGTKNSQFHYPDNDYDLLGYAWQLWLHGKSSDLVDPLMKHSLSMSEVLRCMQVGLLCVQQWPEDRPTMSSVLMMLTSESAALPQPKYPGYYRETSINDFSSPSSERLGTTRNMTNNPMEKIDKD